VKYIIACFFIFNFICAPCWAQYPYVQVIAGEKGFGHSNISVLFEDHQGVIWVGTELGLLRFDGLQTTTYLPQKDDPNSISNEYIYDMFENSKHVLWVATRKGLNSIDPSRKIITRYFLDTEDSTSIPNNRVFQLVPDSDSTFFIISDHSGLALFNSNTGKTLRLNPEVHSVRFPMFNGHGTVTRCFKTPDGKVFAATTSKLCQYDRINNILTDIQDTVTGIFNVGYFGNYYPLKEGVVWMSDFNGTMYKWIPEVSLQSFDYPELKNEFRAGRFWIMEYNHDHLLLSTGKNYWLMDKECGQLQPLKFRDDQTELLEQHSINTCLETSKGIVIMGSLSGKLYLVDPLLQLFKYKNLINEQTDAEYQTSLSDFIEDKEYDTRYISVLQGTYFFAENMTTHQVKEIPKPRESNISNKWKLDQKGRLWLCDGSTIKQVSRIDQTLTSYSPSEPVHNMFNMEEIRPGEFMIGTLIEGLLSFKPDQDVFDIIPETKGWNKAQIYSLKLDRQHSSLWIGTVSKGLYRYDIAADTFYHYQYDSHNPTSPGGDFVKDITVDSMGYAWFATDPGGLSRFDYHADPDSAFINFTMSDGLPTHYISGLETDRDGNIWMLSLNGIASLHPKDFSISLYGKTDGLPKTKFINTSISISANNEVFIGTSKGYIYFNPDSLSTNHTPPGLDIRDVLVLNKSRLTRKTGNKFAPLTLNYKENYLTIQFSVVNYTEPENNTVQYILEGFDDEWNVRSGIHEVSYTKVPPGDYTFRIRAANNDGVWNPEESAMAIIIRPPFWQRTWFYFLIGAFVSGLVFAFYSYKLKQTLKQKLLIAEKEWLKNETEQQLTQLEMKALRAQMNPHFIFNCLNSINRFIVVNDNESASEYLTKFSRLIRQVLDNSRGEKVGLATEIETLKLYIEMEFLRFGNKFEYNITLQEELDPAAFVVQPMLIQPYVENAIWHGLMHRKEKGILRINFSRLDNSLLVVIEDNGVGRVMAKKIKESQVITRKSHGMQVTAERMSLLSKRMKVPVEAIVDDLYDDDLQSIGTRVSITLPLEPK